MNLLFFYGFSAQLNLIEMSLSKYSDSSSPPEATQNTKRDVRNTKEDLGFGGPSASTTPHASTVRQDLHQDNLAAAGAFNKAQRGMDAEVSTNNELKQVVPWKG